MEITPAQREKIDQALALLVDLGLPPGQHNDRSALTLLALLDLKPDGQWSQIGQPMIGVTPIMDWIRDHYGRAYAPNTRETIRRQTLHQFVEAGITLYNPDEPTRPVNSPRACYQIEPATFALLRHVGQADWRQRLAAYLAERETLKQQYARERDMNMIPLVIEDARGSYEIKLTPGAHSDLIKQIVTEFGPRFAPGAEVIYVGDTGAKSDFFRADRLAELGVVVDKRGKLPDVVLYLPDRDWLIWGESVTSHGPVDSKRQAELATLFKDAKPGLVYLTAFPDRATMRKYLSDISWETEVWVADAPTHLIHFNGERFLGPY